MRRTAILLATIVMLQPALAIDRGQSAADPEMAKWFESLRQPDNPGVSCCGVADAYWADSFEVTPGGDYVAVITDERDVPGRKPIPVGTKVTIPKKKITFKQSNPTGHGIVFVSPYSQFFSESPKPLVESDVYCYLPPGGV